MDRDDSGTYGKEVIVPPSGGTAESNAGVSPVVNTVSVNNIVCSGMSTV